MSEALPPRQALNGPVKLADYDAAWPAHYETLAALVRGALGSRVAALHHAGSTSVPGLAAKPVIDVLLEVADSTEEGDYVRRLQAAGFALHIREAEWFEHRLLRHGEPAANLHVFTAGCEEVTRMLAFGDHLRRNPEDRRLYESVKRELAARRWAVMQDYADAKSAVVGEIMQRALLSPRR